MKLDATGTLTDSIVMGGRLPELTFEAHLDRGGLTGERQRCASKDSTPASLQIDRHSTDRSRGPLTHISSVCDVNAPMTPDAITADGRATLASSAVGGLQIDSAELEGKYDGQVGDVTKLDVAGPDSESARVGPDRARSRQQLEPEVSRRRSQSGGSGQAGRTGIRCWFSDPRGHVDRQCRVARSHRHARRQQSVVRGQQRARSEQPVHRNRTGTSVCERPRQGHDGCDVREDRSGAN